MNDDPTHAFGKFVPGFDFLQNLAKGTAPSVPGIPNLSNWVAPTLNVEELDKRIGDLKAVHFWLDQNAKALGATIQALEVQKMTLATLRGMNVSMGEIADALRLKPSGETGGSATRTAAKGGDKEDKGRPKATGAALVDPMQWWGALTQQFQQIAADALKDSAHGGADAARAMADKARAAAGTAGKSASGSTATAGRGAAPAPRAPRKTATRKQAAR